MCALLLCYESCYCLVSLLYYPLPPGRRRRRPPSSSSSSSSRERERERERPIAVCDFSMDNKQYSSHTHTRTHARTHARTRAREYFYSSYLIM